MPVGVGCRRVCGASGAYWGVVPGGVVPVGRVGVVPAGVWCQWGLVGAWCLYAESLLSLFARTCARVSVVCVCARA